MLNMHVYIYTYMHTNTCVYNMYAIVHVDQFRSSNQLCYQPFLAYLGLHPRAPEQVDPEHQTSSSAKSSSKSNVAGTKLICGILVGFCEEPNIHLPTFVSFLWEYSIHGAHDFVYLIRFL